MADLDLLFSSLQLGDITLSNRAVMAPLTRSRAIGGVPNALMASYYSQRASAGLIITEGTAPSPNGLGYPRIPGIFSEAQIEGWRETTEAVHARGGHIFLQLMHTGRIGHPNNLPDGAEVLAPSAVTAAGEMYTDAAGMQPHPQPKAMTTDDIEAAIGEYITAAENAIRAGFDGIEIHAANGYLANQFLNPRSNQRDDAWGGSPERRNHFVLEVARQTAAAIGGGRTGIRLSPHGVFNDLGPYDGIDDQYASLAEGLGALKLAYLHLVDHSSLGAPEVPAALKATLRTRFGGTIILSGGYDAARAEADLQAGRGELVAFGRPFLANPDLLDRFKAEAPLNAPRPELFYTPGPEGYVDYPLLSES
ncbi:MAG: N-ethylmaleimide reductase [Myxococcota bacterium]|jgi:N-ethylmaleimide reductase